MTTVDLRVRVVKSGVQPPRRLLTPSPGWVLACLGLLGRTRTPTVCQS